MTVNRETGQSPIPVAISMMDVLRGMMRRKIMIGGLGLCALFGGAGLVNVLQPTYSTEAQLLVQNLETPFDRVQAQDNQRGDAVDDRVVASQMAVLKSEDLGRRVIAALALENNPEFNSLLTGMGRVSQLKLALGFGEDPRLKTPEQRALERYNDQLNVYQQPNSNVIAIKYTSLNPDTASKVANTLAETYVTWTRESQSQPTGRVRDWLAQQIDALRRKLARSEEAVEKFRAKAGLLQGTSSTLGTQEISELNTQITVARTASSEARARADAIRYLLKNKGNVEASPDVLASAAVQRLKEQRGEVARRVAELSATYLPNHPRMIAAQSELSNLDRQIRSEALKVVTSLEEQARVADAREKSLRVSLDQLKTLESTANLNDVKLKALEREAAADRALLETLLSRYAEASTRQDESAQPGLARIIQSAGVPAAPTFPKRGPMVVLITIAGLSFAFGLAFLIELMAAASRLNTVTIPSAARDEQGTAAAMPAPAKAPVQPAHLQFARQPPPDHSALQHPANLPRIPSLADAPETAGSAEAAAAARQLADWVIGLHRETGVSRIATASMGAATGDTSVASIALARELAATGKRVAVADLAPSGSWLEALCGVAPGLGLSELVSGTADFTKVIGRDAKSTVHLLRYGGDRSPRTTALLAERTGSILAALAQTYDLVVINLGELQPDTPGLIHKCEAAVVLAPVQRLNDATSAVQALLTAGLRAARHVLTGQPAANTAPDLNLRVVNA